MWGREVDGLRLTFHLAGINNQNFLMRDDQTGTYWQQITGRAISGPLAGRTLPLVASEELTFAQWKAEQPRGTVLEDDARYVAEYAPKNWDVKMKKVRTVLSYAGNGLADRDVMLGVEVSGTSRAFPYDAVIAAKLVQDHVGPQRLLLVVGPDGQSVRVFRAEGAEFYRIENSRGALAPLMLDDAGNRWNFQGCAVEGPSKGKCLGRVEALEDYWFDWRRYHPETTVWRPRQ